MSEEILKQILNKLNTMDFEIKGINSKLSTIDNRLNNLEEGQKELKTDITDLKAGQKELKEDITSLKAGQKKLEEGQDLLLKRQFFLDGKFDITLSEIQNKQDKILSAVDSFVHRLVRVEDEQAIIGYRQQEHSEKLEVLESKIA